MHAVNVQSVFIQCLISEVISWYIRTTNSFAVVYAVKISNVETVLYVTLRNVLIN